MRLKLTVELSVATASMFTEISEGSLPSLKQEIARQVKEALSAYQPALAGFRISLLGVRPDEEPSRVDPDPDVMDLYREMMNAKGPEDGS